MTTSALLLSLAVLAASGPSTARARAGLPGQRRRAGRSAARDRDPLGLASTLDVLALCLAAGMAVPDAAVAAARSAPSQLAEVLRRSADLLALGADPATAWSPPPEWDPGLLAPQTEALLRLARRSAASGARLADGVTDLAARCRDDLVQAGTTATERAGVLIAAPLGVCFLPAFVCLGIVPVVAGLARNLLQSGLL